MYYIAFTLGLFGSLHCVGMCGPLAIAFSNKEGNTRLSNFKSGISYNLGRTTTYTLMGLLFGLLGSFLYLADLQKLISVVLGLLLILSFFLSINLDEFINNKRFAKRFYQRIRNEISKIMAKSDSYHPYTLGVANGLLPCGLVYLALAGSLASGSLTSGMVFMALFGLGTIPMLLALTSGSQFLPIGIRYKFRTVLPYVTLCFGIFLVYRGFAVDMPTELSFWEALKNPILCH